MKIAIVLLAALITTSALANDRPDCKDDNVVWVNSKSHIYHYTSTTLQGSFMCEQDATKSGNRAAKNEPAPKH